MDSNERLERIEEHLAEMRKELDRGSKSRGVLLENIREELAKGREARAWSIFWAVIWAVVIGIPVTAFLIAVLFGGVLLGLVGAGRGL